MEPRIQYAKTADGVSIAFWTLGEGMPLVLMTVPFLSHVEKEWEVAALRGVYERLASKGMLIRYDGRGLGMSERDVTEITLDTMVIDLAAVVDHLHLEQFVLIGTWAGAAAIAYAAASPERVSHLILSDAVVRGADASQTASARAYRALRDADWSIYVENFGRMLRGAAELMREAITPEMHKMVLDAIDRFEVTHLLSRVQCPTLVLHNRAGLRGDLDAARRLAAGISGARLVVFEEPDLALGMGSVAEAIEEFLKEGAVAPPPAKPVAPSGLVTVLFTDIEGSTALRQRLGDAKAQELLHAHNTIVREALRAHSGTEIKHTGDGIMASFPSASGAIECAVAVQQAVAAHVEQHADAPLSVYIGLNAGEPIVEEQDLFGTAVDLARRICDQAQGGEILASDVVRQLAAGKGFLFADRGDVALRGFEDPVRLYEVRWRAEGSP